MPRWRILFLLCCCCSRPTLTNGVLRKPAVVYRLTPPDPSRWKPIDFNDNDLAFAAVGSPHVMAINSTCRGTDDASLETLTNHLVFGLTERELKSQLRKTIDSREALDTVYLAKLDGVTIEIEFVVLKKNGCVHDFTLISPPGQSAPKQSDFNALVSSFLQEWAQ